MMNSSWAIIILTKNVLCPLTNADTALVVFFWLEVSSQRQKLINLAALCYDSFVAWHGCLLVRAFRPWTACLAVHCAVEVRSQRRASLAFEQLADPVQMCSGCLFWTAQSQMIDSPVRTHHQQLLRPKLNLVMMQFSVTFTFSHHHGNIEHLASFHTAVIILELSWLQGKMRVSFIKFSEAFRPTGAKFHLMKFTHVRRQINQAFLLRLSLFLNKMFLIFIRCFIICLFLSNNAN